MFSGLKRSLKREGGLWLCHREPSEAQIAAHIGLGLAVQRQCAVCDIGDPVPQPGQNKAVANVDQKLIAGPSSTCMTCKPT
jgi:hypothetical protein